MRPVDADAFKKVLSEHEMQHNKRRNFDEYSYGAASAYEHAGDLLDEMPTVERPQWIPCSERLPSDAIHVDDMVLVCYENGSIRFNSFMDGKWVQGNPIAWMPLPEPYKSGEAE